MNTPIKLGMISLILVNGLTFGMFLTSGMAAPAPQEILLLHFADRGNRLLLEGAMISPGRFRARGYASRQDAFQLELLAADGRILIVERIADPRHSFAEIGPNGHLSAQRATFFSLRLPWLEGASTLRIRDGAGVVLFETPLSQSWIQRARDRYGETERLVLSQSELARRTATELPARIESSTQFPERYLVEEERLRSADQIGNARLSLRGAFLVASGASRAALTASVRILDTSGQPVANAGVVAVDPASGKTLAGVETDPDGRAALNVPAAKLRLYIFPPYGQGGTPAYARKTVEVDLGAKSALSQDVVLEAGALVGGLVARAGSGPVSGYAVTAVEATANQSVEYARSDASGRYSLRLPLGRYRFYIGPRAGAGLLVSEVRDVASDISGLDFTVSASSLVQLDGRVVSASGQPITGARVAVFDSAANLMDSVPTEPDGTFRTSASRDGFVFVYPNSSTSYLAVTLDVTDRNSSRMIVLPQLPAVQTPDPGRPQLGLVYGDAADRSRLNLVFIGDGYTAFNETFTDINGNGVWDGDSYLDENRNGRYEPGEYFFDRDGVAGYQAPEPFQDLNGDGTCNRGEQGLFDRNVVDYVRVLLGTSPWRDLSARLNIWRIRTTSNQAAGSLPEFGIVRDTVLDTSYGLKSMQFLISVADSKAAEMVQALVPDYDHILVVSNSPLAIGRANANFGGNLRLRGGNFDNLSTVLAHELGHAVGLLADEYADWTMAASRYLYKGAEPTAANITTIAAALQTKWAAELDGTVPYPTPDDFAGVGLFEGAGSYFRGLYRPEHNCMMRFNTPRFCAVCNREMQARILRRSGAHSLNFPLLVFNDDPNAGERLVTAFSAINPDPGRSVALGYTAYRDMGELVGGHGVSNPALQKLDPLRQTAAFDREIFGLSRPQVGWVEANTATPAKGFYLIADSRFAEKTDGATANPEAAPDLALPYVNQTDGSRFYFSVVNPSELYTPVLLTFYDPMGKVLAEETRHLLPKGQVFVPAPEGQSGWIRIRSTMGEPVALQAAGLSYDDKTMTVQSGAPLAVAADRFVFPHYALGSGFETRLVLTSVVSRLLEIKAWGNDGTLLRSVSRAVAAGQQLVEPVAKLFGLDAEAGVEVGYITVSAPGGLSGIAGLTHFMFKHESAAVSPGERTPRTTLTFSHIANDIAAARGKTFLTGLTLVNPTETAAELKVTVYDKNGAALVERPIRLGARHKISRLLSGDPTAGAFFSSPLSANSGYIVVTSDQPLFGFELFFTDDLSLMAAVPAQ